jgi:hypothetical protein
LQFNKLYTGLVSKVKWKGNTSNSFQIHQGVRQGGILSPFLYKLFVLFSITALVFVEWMVIA